jgi:hypothetical protein
MKRSDSVNAPKGHRERLESLENAELGSVVFVRDYVQLVFEGRTTATLTAYTWPVLSCHAKTVAAGTASMSDIGAALHFDLYCD